MTPKQQRFVEEYLVDSNATQAALRAGYSPKTANEQSARLLANVSISAAIKAAQTEIAKKLGLDAQWVLQRLKVVSDRSVQAVPVLDHEGNETGEYRFDSTGANRATELIGKYLSMFDEKHVVSGPNGGPIPVKLYDFDQSKYPDPQ